MTSQVKLAQGYIVRGLNGFSNTLLSVSPLLHLDGIGGQTKVSNGGFSNEEI